MDSPTTSIDDALLSPQYVESPYEVFQILRDEYPVYWSRKWNAWLVTRYEDVQHVLYDVRRFSNRGRYTNYLAPLTLAERRELRYLEHHYEHGGLVQSDPPAHSRLRKLVNSAFSPRIIRQMDGLVRNLSAELISDFADADEAELIYQFSFALPAVVIAGMLGVPAAERDQFKEWSAAIQRFLGAGKIDFSLALAAQDAWKAMNGYFTALLAERRAQPQDDLLTALVAASEAGQVLTEDEVIRTCGAVLIAGHETTTNLISNAIWLLLQDKEQLEMLRSDADLMPSAVEEFLRFESPFQAIPRTVAEDLELRGQSLERGQLVYAMLGAANRDPLVFDQPDVLNLKRENNKHLAFGYGIHFCLGAPLARLEAPIAIAAILDTFPAMRLHPDRPPVWKKSMVQRGMESLRVQLH